MDFACIVCEHPIDQYQIQVRVWAHPQNDPLLRVAIFCDNCEEEIAFEFVDVTDMRLSQFAEAEILLETEVEAASSPD